VARILIAEDDALVSSFVEKGLRANGYTTELADDGEQATELALTGEFDLLLLDMALPKREGFDVLRDLRARGCDIPVIVVTGRPEMRELVSNLRVGADDFMTKPFRFEELLSRVNAQLRLHGTHQADVPDAHDLAKDGKGSRSGVVLRGVTRWRES
jgi:two-component system copper resistance phosphate regulon response regulator CusR